MVKVLKVLEAADGRETVELRVKRIKEDVREKEKACLGVRQSQAPEKRKG